MILKALPWPRGKHHKDKDGDQSPRRPQQQPSSSSTHSGGHKPRGSVLDLDPSQYDPATLLPATIQVGAYSVKPLVTLEQGEFSSERKRAAPVGLVAIVGGDCCNLARKFGLLLPQLHTTPPPRTNILTTVCSPRPPHPPRGLRRARPALRRPVPPRRRLGRVRVRALGHDRAPCAAACETATAAKEAQLERGVELEAFVRLCKCGQPPAAVQQ